MSITFSKNEKLKSRKLIELLFSEGKTISNFPLKLFYLQLDEGENHQVAFAVPKRNFRLAVSRNRIKRQMREAYRLHKHMLSHDNGKKFALLFLYISKDKPQYAQLDSSVKALLKKNSL
jgi:ribonuclease P protein component